MKKANRAPFGVYPIIDSGRDVALIRYDGDPDVFSALAEKYLNEQGIERPIEPPRPRLYRMNPVNDYEYSWSLGMPERPGRGVFLGSVLTVARDVTVRLSSTVAQHGCYYCEAKPGECHELRCVTSAREIREARS